jgi:hypothetical protein
VTATAMPAGLPLRMARATWYRHRPAIIAILAIFAAATIVLIVQGAMMRSALAAEGIGKCIETGAYGSACPWPPPQAWEAFLTHYGYTAADIVPALYLLPLSVAVFAGVPWLTREFETGSFRYTWVQGVSRADWLLGTFAPLAATATLGAVACGLAFDWWYVVAQWPAWESGPPWEAGGFSPAGWQPFGLAPETLMGLTLLAMSLALLAGVLIRRTVPAMAACAVACVGCFTLVQWPLRDWLTSLAPIVARGQYGYPFTPRWNDLVLHGWLTGPDGRPGSSAVLDKLNSLTVSQYDTWLTQHGYTYWIAYQPHDRLWLFQFATAAVLLTASAALLLTATRLLRNRPPE